MSSVSQSSPRDPSSRAGSVQVLEKKDPSELDAVSQDILRIIPSNREAKNAFDELIQMEKEGKLHEIHSQYLYATGTRLVDKSEVKTSRESDETTDESLSDNQYRQNKQQVHEGYFRLHFGLPMVSKGLKWVSMSLFILSARDQYHPVLLLSPPCLKFLFNPPFFARSQPLTR